MVDHLSPERSPWAKIAKDTAAGAVLVCAAASVAVGFWLHWRPRELAALAVFLLTTPWAFLLALFAAGLGLAFIFLPGRGRDKGEEKG